MRNLKRALSLALASIMVLGMMVVGAGAVNLSDFSDKDKIANKEAVTVLTTLNVINGKEDGTYDPEGIVTRAEMAKMICVILNGGRDPQLGESLKNTYTDTVGHWAAGYIEYCTTLGIVAGRGNGTFDPSGTVTVAEAGKMILVALGYNAGVQGYTGSNWQINVDAQANPLGLYDGLGTLNTNVNLTRDNAAQMLYNALDLKMVTYDYVITGTADNSLSTKPQINDKDKGTLLKEKFNAVKVEGIVIGNEAADMTSKKTDDDYATKGDVIGNSLDANKTKMLITNGGADEDQNDYTGTQTFNVASDASVLGRKVALFVKIESNANKAQVIGSAIVSDDNKVVMDYTDDSIKDVADDNNLDFTDNTKIAYNYAAQTSLTSATADNKKATGVDTGIEKILVDTDGDGDLDYVLINTVQLGKVTKYSTASDGSITVSLQSGNGVYTVDKKADVVGFDDVAKDDYVLTSFIGGKLHVEKAETVTGTIEAYKNNSKGDKTTLLTVDGTDYTVSNAPTYTASDFFAANTTFVKDKTELDTDATFYLDAQGYIIASGEVVETVYNYAYVRGVGNSGVEDRVRVTLSDGTTGTYTLNSTSSVKYKDVKEGMVFAYTLNSDKTKIKFTEPTSRPVNGNQDNVKVTFEKGKSGIKVGNLETFYANNSTAFFYVSEDENGNIDKVNAYNGRANAPTVKNDAPLSSVSIAMNKSNSVAAVVFRGVEVEASVGDHLFVYKLGKTTSDYRLANVILNGKETAEEIKIDNGSTPKADTLYTYTVNGDGYYELDDVDGEDFYHYGTVYNYDDTLVLKNMDNNNGTGEFKVDATTVVIDNDDDPSTPDAAIRGNVGEGDSVQILVDDDVVKMIVITKYADSDGTDGPGVDFGKPGNAETIRVYNDANDVTDIKAAFDDGKNVIINSDWTMKAVLNVPAGRTLYVDGDLTTTNATNLVNRGTVKVTGVLKTEGNLTGDFMADTLDLTDAASISGKTTVADEIKTGANITVNAGAELYAKTLTMTAGDLTVDGHCEINGKTVTTGNVVVNSSETLIVKGALECATLTVDEGKVEAASVTATTAVDVKAKSTVTVKGTIEAPTVKVEDAKLSAPKLEGNLEIKGATPDVSVPTVDGKIENTATGGSVSAGNSSDSKVELPTTITNGGTYSNVEFTQDTTIKEDVTIILSGEIKGLEHLIGTDNTSKIVLKNVTLADNTDLTKFVNAKGGVVKLERMANSTFVWNGVTGITGKFVATGGSAIYKDGDNVQAMADSVSIYA